MLMPERQVFGLIYPATFYDEPCRRWMVEARDSKRCFSLEWALTFYAAVFGADRLNLIYASNRTRAIRLNEVCKGTFGSHPVQFFRGEAWKTLS